MERIILHVDVNNAFLSWSAVWLLKNGYEKDIRNRYAIIAGDETQRRGIVLAKSNLCKKKGVKTAEAIYLARKKCPYLEIYPPRYDVYKKFSDMMYKYLCNYTNIIERYSIDECFLDYTGSVKLFGDPVKVAYKINLDLRSMLVLVIINYLLKWLLTLKSLIKYIRYLVMRSKLKCFLCLLMIYL